MGKHFCLARCAATPWNLVTVPVRLVHHVLGPLKKEIDLEFYRWGCPTQVPPFAIFSISAKGLASFLWLATSCRFPNYRYVGDVYGMYVAVT